MGVGIARFEMAAPDDVSGLAQLLRHLGSDSVSRLAIIAKIEGTATLNDFSRSLALRVLGDHLAAVGLADAARSQIILSVGCEGVITPGGWLIAETPTETPWDVPGLAFGIARSEPLAPTDVITAAHARAASRVTHDAMKSTGVADDEVKLVLMKSPVLTGTAAEDLPSARRSRVTSTSLSRGVAALGIGAALGEIDEHALVDETAGAAVELYSRRAMVFSGTETRRCEAIVLAGRVGSTAALRSGTIEDLLDMEGIAKIIAPGAAAPVEAVRAMARRGAIKAAFLKAGLAPDGRLRGQRTTVFASDLDPDKHMRAAASGVLGALLGDTRVFVSGGAEHQAPAGGGVFAAVVAEEGRIGSK